MMIATEQGVEPLKDSYVRCSECGLNFLTCNCEFPADFIQIVKNQLQHGVQRSERSDRSDGRSIRTVRKTSALEFNWNGTQLELEFSYSRQSVAKPGEKYQTPSDQPYTTVKLVEVRPGQPREAWQVFAGLTASVGCASGSVRDQFNYETGRKLALRKLTRKLPKEMRAMVWETYLTRKDRNPPTEQKRNLTPIALPVLDAEVVGHHV